MSFKNILSFRELLGEVSQIKKDCGSLSSNIFPVESIYSKAIRNGLLFGKKSGGCFFALEDKGEFFTVFFAAPAGFDVLSELKGLRCTEGIQKPMVLEHVIREGKDISLGSPEASLRRMMHTGDLLAPQAPAPRAEGSGLLDFRFATPHDLPAIRTIFSHHFNALTERIPDDDELLHLIDNNGVAIAADGDATVGFIVFEREGQGLHLRYWWTSPDHRGRGIGSALMNFYFKASEGTRRQFLWVFDDNENAIKRYRHYGFEFDGTRDEIYVL